MLYVVTYDVVCDRRRRRVAALLEGYGRRVQYSVFECVLEDRQVRELVRRLGERVKREEDSVRVYPISGQMVGRVVVMGGVEVLREEWGVIV